MDPTQYSNSTRILHTKIPNIIQKIHAVCHRIKTGVKTLRSNDLNPSFAPVADYPFAKTVPKGHIAVYVGQKDGDFHRILVSVVDLNHPLFGELLTEAEEEYGFEQPGGISIPCGFTEFERIQTRIKSGPPAGKFTWRPRSRRR